MLTIQPLQQSEINAAAGVIAAIFSERWRAYAVTEFNRLFKGDAYSTHVFTAKHDGDIVGAAACIETYFTEHCFGLCWVGMLPDYRHQGAATRLVKHVENFIKADQLQGKPGTIILSSPVEVRPFYEKLGYETNPTPMHDGAPLLMKVF